MFVAVSDYHDLSACGPEEHRVSAAWVKPSIETILSFHPDLVVGTNIPGYDRKPRPIEKRRCAGLSSSTLKGLPGILRSVKSVARRLNRVPAGGCSRREPYSRRITAVRGAHCRKTDDPGFGSDLV